MKEKLVIWGASGHASVIVDIIRLQDCYEIVGVLDSVCKERHGSFFCGVPILGGEELLSRLREQGVNHAVVGIGNCQARLKLSDVLRTEGFALVTAIHPAAIIASTVEISPGTVVVAGAVINPGTVLGESVIINTSASVDHDCLIDDGVHICPGVHLAGNVSVGRGAWVGIGATVIEKVHIGSHALIGAGAVVLRDVPANSIVYGVPARITGRRIDT